MTKSSEQKRAEELGTSVEDMRQVEDGLRAMPMDRFLDALFGSGNAAYDASADLWIAVNPNHTGPGFGFMAIRRDKSFFCGVIPPEALQ
jgi:hypothetical protein